MIEWFTADHAAIDPEGARIPQRDINLPGLILGPLILPNNLYGNLLQLLNSVL